MPVFPPTENEFDFDKLSQKDKVKLGLASGMDDVNNGLKVEETEANDPATIENNSDPDTNTSNTDWSGYFSNSGDNGNGSQTTNFTGLETSNNGQSTIVSGISTTLVVESRIDGSGNGVDYRGLTIETGTQDHFEDVFSDGQGRYSYVAWGDWNGSADITSTFSGQTQNYTITHGFWMAGNETSSQNMPRTGSASYSGLAVGDLVRNGMVLRGSVNGTVGLNMNFANGTFTGNMRLTENNLTWANPQISGVIDSADADFRSTSMTGVSNGNINGNFYGPGAQEVGGAWAIQNNSGERAIGVFRAK